MSDTRALVERVRQFNAFELPGQPLAMHMGTSYLVNDLWRRIEELERALRGIVAIELTLDYAINAASEMKRMAREAIQQPSQPPEP